MKDGPWSTDHGISKAPSERIEDLQDGGHRGYQTKCFSNSESPRHPNASHQVWAQSDLPFGSGHGLTILKMATEGAILDI